MGSADQAGMGTSKKNSNSWKLDWDGYLYILPAFVIIAVFHIFPVLYAFVMSFFDWNVMSGKSVFVGLSNYKEIFEDPMFRKAFWNTIYYVVVTVPLGIAASLFVAILLNQKIKLRGFYRVLYFLPVVTSLNAVSVVWKWIYHPTYGLLNAFLKKIGLPPVDWLGDPRFAMPAIILMSVWKNMGYNVVIFLAALQNVPKELYESAEIDGAGAWAKFWNVTVPMISPTLFFVIITSVIASFQVFAQIWIMTPEGGPLGSTTVLVYYLYQQAFQRFRMGYGCALAFVIFIILAAFSFLQKKIGERKVHYEV